MLAVNRSQIAALVSPFIPDGNAVFLQIGDIGVAFQEPQQFVDDRFQMQLLRRDQREALLKIEAHLMAENRHRPGAGPILLLGPRFEDMAHEVEVLAHGSGFCRWTANP